MYGRWLSYYMAARSRQLAQFHPSLNGVEKSDVSFDWADDLWIFARLALVLAVFLAGLGCIVWIAG